MRVIANFGGLADDPPPPAKLSKKDLQRFTELSGAIRDKAKPIFDDEFEAFLVRLEEAGYTLIRDEVESERHIDATFEFTASWIVDDVSRTRRKEYWVRASLEMKVEEAGFGEKSRSGIDVMAPLARPDIIGDAYPIPAFGKVGAFLAGRVPADGPESAQRALRGEKPLSELVASELPTMSAVAAAKADLVLLMSRFEFELVDRRARLKLGEESATEKVDGGLEGQVLTLEQVLRAFGRASTALDTPETAHRAKPDLVLATLALGKHKFLLPGLLKELKSFRARLP